MYNRIGEHMKVSKCLNCNFKTKEKHKICPICKAEMKQTYGEVNYNPNLPERIDVKADYKLYYFCYKCRSKSANKICLQGNVPGFLTLEYNEKTAIINYIESLDEVYDEDEVSFLAHNLTKQEKYWLYHNFDGSDRFFYRRDKNKAFACFLLAILMYSLCLTIATEYALTELIIISYATNALANGFLAFFIILGTWYLIDASSVEYEKTPAIVGLIIGTGMFVYFLISLFLDLSFKHAFILGFIFIFLASLIYIIYYFINKKKEHS